jgi:hypothetical protein
MTYFGWPNDGTDPSSPSYDTYTSGSELGLFLTPYICPGSGTQNVVELSCFMKSFNDSPTTGQGRLAVYNSSYNLVFQTTLLSATSNTPSWIGLTTGFLDSALNVISPTFTSGQIYYLAFSGGPKSARYAYRHTTSGDSYYQNNTYYGTDGYPTSINLATWYQDDDYQYAIRCGVDPAAGGVSIPVVMDHYMRLMRN